MALELRPNCACCDKDLSPTAADARICTYECTFCARCADTVLFNVCPNCGGRLRATPYQTSYRAPPGLSLAKRPASTTRMHLSYDREEVARFAQMLRDTPPAD